ncbi:MAG: ATP-binding protein [Gallionella sp.]|nr:ATP-binding protein [Gallionella sp.]
MLNRSAFSTALRLAQGFPVLAITGPRQSGKTTMARTLFAGKPYVSLEDPEERSFADTDPRGFLARFPQGAILDEVQRCPDLFSYLQGVVDERQRMGEFIITGSQQFGLMSNIAQSLAGRVGLLQLLPFSLAELKEGGMLPATLDAAMLQGCYPPLYDRPVMPADWFPNYVSTYLERDVRQLLAVRDLSLFQRFLKMCAARSGQLLNLSALAADCGISHVTAREWMTVLEASYIVYLLRPHHRNFGKRLVKMPKLYFLDAGLMAYLLGIRDTDTLSTHASRGALFETLVVSEWVKRQFNAGQVAELYFWRDSAGHEVDLLIPNGNQFMPVEIKSGSTFSTDWTAALRKLSALFGDAALPPGIVFGGEGRYEREGCQVVGWQALAG